MKYNSLLDVLLKYKGKIIWILLISSMSLWLLTISTTHIVKVPPDTIYYAKQLPSFYWIGMVLNCFTFILLLGESTLSSIKIRISHLFFITILILYIMGTPSFIYAYPRIIDVYGMCHSIDAMMSVGGLITPDLVYSAKGYYELQGYLIYTNDFPGANIFFHIFCQIVGIRSISLAMFYPIFLMFTLCFLLYTVSKRTAGDYALVAPVAYLSLTSFVQEYNLAPQAQDLLLTMVFLLVLIPILQGQNKDLLIKKSVLIFLWIIIVISHPSTPIINIICFFVIFILCIAFERMHLFTNRFFDLPKDGLIRIKKNYQGLLLLFIVTFLAYIVYKSNFILFSITIMGRSIISNLLTGNTFILAQESVQNPAASYVLLYYLRWSEILAIIVFGLFSILLLFFFYNKNKILAFIFSTLFVGYMSLSALGVALGNVYATSKGVIFGMLSCAIIFSMVLNPTIKETSSQKHKNIYERENRRTCPYKKIHIFRIALIMLIIFYLLIAPIARYGSDPYNTVTESEFYGMKFVSRHPDIRLSAINFIIPQDPSVYTSYWYNLYELLQQKGIEYDNIYASKHKIYDSGPCGIYRQPKVQTEIL